MADEVEPHPPDPAQVERAERKIVSDTEKQGGTVHEFNPDASPKEKAAAVKKARFQYSSSFELITDFRPCHWDSMPRISPEALL
jgi:hypothetical protein